MIKQHLLRYIALMGVALTSMLPSGCSKNEQPVEEPAFSGLYIKAILADTLRLRVINDGRELTNTLFSPGNRVSVPVTFYDPRHRIQVYNFYGNALLLDTLITYKPTAAFYLSFFQRNTGEKLQWIGPPVNEPLPEPGFLKVSVIYTAAQLPSSVKVVVENAATADVNATYVPTDSFLLNKGAFSRYFTGRNLRSYKPRLRMYTADAERKLIATAAPAEFRTTNFDFSTFLFDRASGSQVFTLTSEKLY